MRHLKAGLLGLLLSASLAPGAAWADRSVATALAEQARKAFDAGDVAQAEALWLKSVQEDLTYLPAQLGLAEAHLSRGLGREGLKELRAALEGAAAEPEAAWANDVARARKRLAELEAAEAAVQARIRKHIEASLALAAKWSAKDPDLARGILARVLRLDPGNAQADAAMGTLGEGQGRVTPLFNGRDASGWVGFADSFQVVDGTIEGNVGPTSQLTMTEEKYVGDFDFRADMRLVEQRGAVILLGLSLLRGTTDVSTFAYVEGNIRGSHETPTNRTDGFRVAPTGMDPPFDPKAWNRLEVRARAATLQCWINGKQVGEFARKDPLVPVHLGVRVQEARVQWRALEVRRL